MKSFRKIMWGGLLMAMTTTGLAQMPPIPPTNTNSVPNTNTVDWVALEAAQQAQFIAEYGPWYEQDASVLDDPTLVSQALGGSPGTFLTANQRFQVRQTLLQNIASANQTELDAELADAMSFAAANDIPTNYVDAVGNTAVLRSIDNGQPVYIITHDLNQAKTIAANAVWTNGATGLNLNGEATFIGMFDAGDVLTNHQEFNGGRVSNFDPTVAQDPHSTHVVGVLASAGVNANAIGMSPKSKATAYPFAKDFTLMPKVASTNHSLVSNHSYGNGVGWQGYQFRYISVGGQVIANGYYPMWNGDPSISKTIDYHFGQYNATATNVDGIAYNANTYLPVFSAGNERGPQGLPNGVANGAANGFVCNAYNGTYGNFVAPGDSSFPVPPADGGTTGYRTISPYGCAKDSLVIGSITNIVGGYQGSSSVKVSWFSSYGPTADGRIKPDVVAPGENIFFPDTNGTASYYTDSGTSFSSPAVAGALNLIVEENARQNGTNAQLLASTLKGLAIHTADAAGTGPNYATGWGMFDAKNAATLFAANAFSNGLPFVKEVQLFDGDYIQFPVTVTNGTAQLKVTICWTDPAGTPFPNVLNPTNLALVNDLDLRVVSPAGVTNLPWVLNPASPATAATKGDNIRDNVEQVVISTPTAGTYTVQVTHKKHIVNAAGQSSAQWVSILTSGIQPKPMPLPQFVSAFAYSTNHLFALKWTSTVGLNYEILQTVDLTSGNWQQASDLISATKTNTAFVLPASTTGSQFFRILALHP